MIREGYQAEITGFRLLKLSVTSEEVESFS